MSSQTRSEVQSAARRSFTQRPLVPVLLYGLATFLAIVSYFYGLDSRYIPKNGDEAVYMHITRLTAQSGVLLPLGSELDNMRNTKPPLLFWQGLLSTQWGEHWDLWRLRVPSVLYTLATGVLVFLLALKLTGSRISGLVGLLSWLAFFSTFRYGRPYLTNPPEIFWLFTPFFVLTYWGKPAFESRWRVPILFGVLIGIGLLYKSFALVLPVGFGLTLWHWHNRGFRIGEFLIKDARKLAISTIISLAMFGLWFVFDPQPAAVWQEFVVGENAQKFDAERGYLRTLFWGASSVWSMLLNYPLNAGLLAVPVAALFWTAIRRRGAPIGPRNSDNVRDATRDVQRLWIWIAALFLVFVLPSQRSGRYLLPAMPALAVLLAVYWHNISRSAFLLSLMCSLLVTALLGYLSVRLHWARPNELMYPIWHWALLAAVLAVVLLGIIQRNATSAASLVAVFLVYLVFAATVRPLDGAIGRYGADAQRAAAARDVWVPCNFRASYESHRFLLPGANLLGYDENAAAFSAPQAESIAAQLALRYPMFALRIPIHGPGCDACKIRGERLEIQSRHTSAQIKAMLSGELFEHLFVRELLVESDHARFQVPGLIQGKTSGTESECR